MPHALSRGVSLYYEQTGAGEALVFAHEFSGDHRSWEPQVRRFARHYRCVTYAARGYPPSDVPEEASCYSLDLAVEDLGAVLDHLSIATAHLVGLSMGSFTVLHFALRYPTRCRSLTLAGVGYGATPRPDPSWRQGFEELADYYLADGAAAAASHAAAPGRMPFLAKDPRGWREFADELARHPAVGLANTMRGVQAARPNLYDQREQLEALEVPLLVLAGDEDDPCLEPGLFLKRTVRSAALAVLPRSGHTLNLEEPARFNELLADFLATVCAGRWTSRRPEALSAPQLGHR